MPNKTRNYHFERVFSALELLDQTLTSSKAEKLKDTHLEFFSVELVGMSKLANLWINGEVDTGKCKEKRHKKTPRPKARRKG